MIKLRPVHGVQLVSIDAPLPPIKGVDGSVVGLGFTVVIEDDYEYARVFQRHFGGKRDSRRHSTRSFGGNVLVLRQQSDQASSNVRGFVIFF